VCERAGISLVYERLANVSLLLGVFVLCCHSTHGVPWKRLLNIAILDVE
jgi:hypothetical protein